MVADQRFHHVRPVRGDARRAVFGHVRQEGITILGVRAGQHGVVGGEKLHAGHAMQRLALCVPAGRVGAAEAVEQVLRLRQRQVAGADLHVQQHQVDVEEEVQVDMHDVQQQRHIARLRHQPHPGHVAPAEQAHRRAGGTGVALRSAIAVQEALHVGQEGDELVVVPLVEVLGIAGVFVHLLAPVRRQQLPGPRVRTLGQRHQAQRPQQHLTQVPDLRAGGGGGGHRHGAQCRSLDPVPAALSFSHGDQ